MHTEIMTFRSFKRINSKHDTLDFELVIYHAFYYMKYKLNVKVEISIRKKKGRLNLDAILHLEG